MCSRSSSIYVVVVVVVAITNLEKNCRAINATNHARRFSCGIASIILAFFSNYFIERRKNVAKRDSCLKSNV